jgi:solute carrier family 8 (sodium/calcium exchanger)
LAFIIAIAWIGLLTALVGDIANHFGCMIGLPDSLTGILFVAVGTSIPGKKD